jgi:predicted permease
VSLPPGTRQHTSRPAVALRLLLLFLPHDMREHVIGDLVEDYAHNVEHHGESRARRAFWRQTIVAICALGIGRRAPVSSRYAPRITPSGDSRMRQLWTDLRHAARLLRTAPFFVVLCAVTLGLGIGSAAAMFGIIERIILRGPEYIVEPHRVMRFYATVRHPPNELETGSITAYAAYRALRDRTHDLAGVAAYQASHWIVGTGADARSLPGIAASADLFSTLGVHPFLGRSYTAREDDPGAPQDVVVLSYEYWIRRFGGDRDILGNTLSIAFRPFTIIGVAPPGFTGAEMSPVDYWIPLSAGAHPVPDWPASWMARWIQVIGRVKSGVSVEDAARDATRAMRLAYTGPDPDWRSVSMSLRPLSFTTEGNEPELTAVARWLTGVTIIVLLIACANIGNLLLARALRRRAEIAVRLVLGMSRRRLAQWLVAEALFLASAGGLIGIAVAYIAGSAIRRFFLADVAWPASVIDLRTVLVIIALTVVVATLVSLTPLFQAGRLDFTQAVKSGARDGGGHHAPVRNGLLFFETTLTGVLLLVAGLFLKSLMNVRGLDLGIQADRVIAASIYWPVSTATDSAALATDAAEQSVTLARIRDSLAHRPDMAGASLVIGSPFRSTFQVDLRVQGWDTLPTLGGGGPYVSAVGADYFQTVGTRLVRGRVFRPGEGQSQQRTAIINETMARTLWPNGDALGKCLYVGGLRRCATVVGVVRDAHRFGIREEPAMQYYVPLGQEIGMKGVTIVARPRRELGPAVDIVHRTLAAIVPGARYIDVAALQDRVDPQIRPWRLGAAMFGLFAMLALLVASAGLYSVIAYLVAQRTHEFGIRLAVGATASNILRLVLAYGLRIAVAGAAAASAIAWSLGRWIAPQLFDESPHDPVVYASVIIVMTCVALVALIAPALRASGTDPAVALRQE